MEKKSARANNAFLLGSLILIVLILLVVVLFVFMSFRIYEKKDIQSGVHYDITINESATGHPISMYLNDSLLFQGTPGTPMTICVDRFAPESSLLVVDGETDVVSILSLPEKTSRVTIDKDSLSCYSDGRRDGISIPR